MFDTMKIAKIIKEARMAKNMTQMNLADCLGVSYQAVSNWERGNSMPDIAKLEDLCKALDLTVEELLGMETKAAAAVEKVIQQEPLTGEELAEVAPILPPETLKEQTRTSEKKYSIADFSMIAPFLDESALEKLAEQLEVKNLTLLTCIAPYLSETALDKLVRRAPADDFNGIGAMAPFLSQETLDYLLVRCEGKPGDWGLFDTLVPFLSPETLNKLVEKYRHDLSAKHIQSLAPFLSQQALNSLVEEKLAQGNAKGLFGLYPFLGQDTMQKIAKHLMESGDLKEVKKAAMYL